MHGGLYSPPPHAVVFYSKKSKVSSGSKRVCNVAPAQKSKIGKMLCAKMARRQWSEICAKFIQFRRFTLQYFTVFSAGSVHLKKSDEWRNVEAKKCLIWGVLDKSRKQDIDRGKGENELDWWFLPWKGVIMTPWMCTPSQCFTIHSI